MHELQLSSRGLRGRQVAKSRHDSSLLYSFCLFFSQAGLVLSCSSRRSKNRLHKLCSNSDCEALNPFGACEASGFSVTSHIGSHTRVMWSSGHRFHDLTIILESSKSFFFYGPMATAWIILILIPVLVLLHRYFVTMISGL